MYPEATQNGTGHPRIQFQQIGLTLLIDTSKMTEEPRLYTSKGMAAYRAPSLLQPHKARQAIADAHAGRIPPLIGLFCAWASPPLTKVVAQLGFDFVWVEWEHASMSVETMTQACFLTDAHVTAMF